VYEKDHAMAKKKQLVPAGVSDSGPTSEYTVVRPILMDGDRYEPGESILLTEDEAKEIGEEVQKKEPAASSEQPGA
jgi:hypothetical protein